MRLSKFMSVAAAAGVSILTSCTTADKDYFNEENVKTVYEQNFIKAFGKPAVNHTWGFGTKAVNEVKDTRSVNPNGNQWADFISVPATITQAESDYVYNYFKNLKATEGGVTLNMTDFFVQQVWTGVDEYVAGNGMKVISGPQMNRLIVGHEHSNNFNNSNNNSWDGKMLIQGGSTDNFGYSNSIDGLEHNGEYIAQVIDVPGVGTGYYVAFDFCAYGQNPNQQVAADGVYTDWIIKVVPGEYKNATRVMCEDLGTTDDFDFNDVVFDVAYTREYWPVDGTFAIITLQAAGGTMPLTVDGVEVHEAFGVATSEMVNTGKGPKLAPVVFRKQVRSTDPNDIAVVVNNTQTAQTYTLESEQGKVPYKIAVPVTVKWADERVKINTAYPKFNEWVADPTKPFWE